jgi:hypothetical protein
MALSSNLRTPGRFPATPPFVGWVLLAEAGVQALVKRWSAMILMVDRGSLCSRQAESDMKLR